MEQKRVTPLKINSLSVSYGRKMVIDRFSGSFGYGAYAIIGINGSGKTSFLKALSGIIPVAKARVLIEGVDIATEPVKAKAFLSFMPDEPYVYPFMVGREYLNLIARIKGRDVISDAHESVKKLSLENYLDVQFKHMSFGTQRKISLVGALLGAPRLLLMDEPMNGLDADSQAFLIEKINVMKSQTVIMFTSHQKSLNGHVNATSVCLENVIH